MIVLRWIIRVVVVLILLLGGLAVGARFHDGPIGPFPGGALASGTVVAEPVTDWSFAADVQEIELQLDTQSISRTTWIIVHAGRAYIPVSTTYPPNKTWHLRAIEDGRATVRVDGKRYPVVLRRVEDPTVGEAVRPVAEKKYPVRPGGEAWLFEISSRPAASS